MDDNARFAPPLSSLLEADEAPQPDPRASNSSTTASTVAVAATNVLHPPNARRRRFFSRFTRLGQPDTVSPSSSAANTRSPTTFNPQAAEFVPAPRMPPKRKASSSARPEKLAVPAQRAHVGGADQPTMISSGELFGADSGGFMPSSSEFESIFDEAENDSEIFELELQDLQALGQHQGQPPHHRQRIHEALTVIRDRASVKVRSTPAPIQSALLYTYDGHPSLGATDASQRIRYLPLRPASSSARSAATSKDTSFTVLPSAQQHIDEAASRSSSSKAQWPPNDVPVEIFELVIDYLSRDDVKSMRLVSKEFEQKVSRSLFNTSVVPFNTELYDMIDEDARVAIRGPRQEGKGKGRVRDAEAALDLRNRLHWLNAKDDAEGKVYRGHGLRVFRGFGPHIKRFGMSFEVAEIQLSRPPIKKELDHVESYFGSYDWPTQQYTRFANLAGLERTADDTLRMKAAFSNLKNVRELGLSLDSGLGWLNGPDRSMRAQIFERPSAIFGNQRDMLDRQTQESQDFWAAIQSCHRGSGTTNFKEMTLANKLLTKSPAELKGMQGSTYGDSRRWPVIAANKVIPSPGASSSLSEDTRHGVLYTTSDSANNTRTNTLLDKSTLVPADLRKEQKEWLLETEWAQRAFLECYMLAVVDNFSVFAKVKSLNIAKLSSGFLPLLANESFWDSLPDHQEVTILVKADWRSVEKDNAGFAETSSQNPSEAVRSFNQSVLTDRVCLRPSVTKLNIGWAAGGEHAEGMFARNANLLPAPIMPLEQSTAVNAHFGMVFNFVEHLTLTNCWITPIALLALVRNHSGTQLQKLTLDSVSLTAHPRFPMGAQQQHFAQALAALQQQQAAGFQQVAAPAAPNINGNPQVPQVQPTQQGLAGWLAANPPPGGLQLGNFPLAPAPQQWLQNWAMNQGAAAGLNGNAGAIAPVVPGPPPGAHNPPVPQQPSHWTAGHREGSWPELLDHISPGPIFSDYLPKPAPWEEQPPERPSTNLQTIEFKSCGYAKLFHNSTFDQFALENGFEHHLSDWFRARQVALTPAMMTTSDRYLGRIVQHIPQRELDALLFAWGLNEGWQDRAKAEEAEYDGLLAGGTGRFSGIIEKDMALVAQPGSA